MTSQTWAVANSELLRHLGVLDEFRARLDKVALGEARQGSRADADAASGFPGWVYAAQNIAMGFDHLRAWRWLLESGKVPQLAHMTLIRAAFEGAATALWLLGSDDSAERVRRAAILGLEDLRNRRTFESLVETRARAEAADRGEALASFDWGSAKSGGDRYNEHMRAMIAAGIAKADIPNYTTLLEDYGPGAHVYALTSAFAHRREWTLAFADEVNRVADPGTREAGALQVMPSAIWALTMTESALQEMAEATRALEAHLGW